MVRVGGGWDTLDHFLLKHDACRIRGMYVNQRYVRKSHHNLVLQVCMNKCCAVSSLQFHQCNPNMSLCHFVQPFCLSLYVTL